MFRIWTWTQKFDANRVVVNVELTIFIYTNYNPVSQLDKPVLGLNPFGQKISAIRYLDKNSSLYDVTRGWKNLFCMCLNRKYNKAIQKRFQGYL